MFSQLFVNQKKTLAVVYFVITHLLTHKNEKASIAFIISENKTMGKQNFKEQTKNIFPFFTHIETTIIEPNHAVHTISTDFTEEAYFLILSKIAIQGTPYLFFAFLGFLP
ncbi:MAG: hypothetical protein D8M57_02100 [Candidatus Scalindua sp. AMX11]|nr:MAG: hypothetical protein DWQ00_13460 [Candidatus Scalindua sp.]TDE66526.1 MAG: hypothetical protein D8M57_02100 [Candidatus Scalindua sp. AMX11]GJQ58892.1 MAG: hypothetical protein SCALA701_16930 [Candidatus Scalindua sp.]